ncbi:class II histone deacetylase [Micrococcus terreus]|uniref:class II histone deacetylase n=1 Tax=Micrococcus terreus TaxID=574650 RepID=UPI0034118AA9
MWSERFAWHDTGTAVGIWPSGGYSQPHQAFESSESKARFAGLVEVSGMIDHVERIRPRLATEDELLRIHTREYLDRLSRLSADRGGDAGDGATPFGPGSYEIARLAAGGVMESVSAVLEGSLRNAYALTRPPGHHAEPDLGRGYCMLSNVTLAVEHARKMFGVERVAIVDYDVHHGNGAQRIYWDDPSVLHVSIHQDRLFPLDSGSLDERGGGTGEGYNINVPLPAGSGNGAYLAAMDRVVAPALQAFRPQLVMVSSGFDPSALDPLGCMSVTSEGFRALARRLLDAAEQQCDGRIVFSHEGGYSAVHVPFCGLAVMEELTGMRTDVDDPFDSNFSSSPAHELQPWQERVIDAAAQMAREIR